MSYDYDALREEIGEFLARTEERDPDALASQLAAYLPKATLDELVVRVLAEMIRDEIRQASELPAEDDEADID